MGNSRIASTNVGDPDLWLGVQRNGRVKEIAKANIPEKMLKVKPAKPTRIST